MKIHPQRIKTTGAAISRPGPVVYWMSRDQRSEDHWGLLYARELAETFHSEMAVVFCLATHFLEATERQYDFMIRGLQETASALQKKNIPFYLLTGNPVENMEKFLKEYSAGHLVYDFDPLRIKQEWQNGVIASRNISFYEVDSHNIVPARVASNKKEFGAYTLRPRIHRKLEEFLEEFPEVQAQQKLSTFKLQQIHWERVISSLQINRNVKAVSWIEPGQVARILRFSESPRSDIDRKSKTP